MPDILAASLATRFGPQASRGRDVDLQHLARSGSAQSPAERRLRSSHSVWPELTRDFQNVIFRTDHQVGDARGRCDLWPSGRDSGNGDELVISSGMPSWVPDSRRRTGASGERIRRSWGRRRCADLQGNRCREIILPSAETRGGGRWRPRPSAARTSVRCRSSVAPVIGHGRGNRRLRPCRAAYPYSLPRGDLASRWIEPARSALHAPFTR
jgi:hypothetical protein